MTAQEALAPRTGSRPWSDDPFAEAMRTGSGPLWLRRDDGRRHPLEVERWCASPDPADWTLLSRCLRRGQPTLDIGCGPGRLIAALQSCGLPALGVDVTRTAVLRARGMGGSALCRSVFDRLPGEGRWGTALLADGNLGIGGAPVALLRRTAELLSPDGQLLVEVDSGDLDERITVAVEDGAGRSGAAFPWARLGARATVRYAATAGFNLADAWTCRGRHFLALRR